MHAKAYRVNRVAVCVGPHAAYARSARVAYLRVLATNFGVLALARRGADAVGETARKALVALVVLERVDLHHDDAVDDAREEVAVGARGRLERAVGCDRDRVQRRQQLLCVAVCVVARADNDRRELCRRRHRCQSSTCER